MALQDEHGFFRITGRYKELIIGAGGENVAPVPLENFLKTHIDASTGRSFGISDAMMVGDKRKYNVCLITLKAKGHTGDLPGGDELDGDALLVNPAVTTIRCVIECCSVLDVLVLFMLDVWSARLRNSGAMNDPVWREHLTAAITAVNSDQEACPSNASKIQKFAILPRNFSVQGGELTPTFKLKRQFVEGQYEAVVEGLYGA